MPLAAINTSSPRGSGRAAPGLAEAVATAEHFLSDGQWKSVSAVRMISLTYQCSFAAIAEAAALADSDSGSFICLPNEKTPLLAPDERGEWAEMSPTERRTWTADDRRAAAKLLNK